MNSIVSVSSQRPFPLLHSYNPNERHKEQAINRSWSSCSWCRSRNSSKRIRNIDTLDIEIGTCTLHSIKIVFFTQINSICLLFISHSMLGFLNQKTLLGCSPIFDQLIKELKATRYYYKEDSSLTRQAYLEAQLHALLQTFLSHNGKRNSLLY